MAFNCIRQHSGKSREFINTTWAELKKGQLVALHEWNIIAWHSATEGDILLVADADTANNGKGGFTVVDDTMEFEVDLTSQTAVDISAWTKMAVNSSTDLTVATGSGFFLTTEDAYAQATKVIGKFVDLPAWE